MTDLTMDKRLMVAASVGTNITIELTPEQCRSWAKLIEMGPKIERSLASSAIIADQRRKLYVEFEDMLNRLLIVAAANCSLLVCLGAIQ